MSRRFPGRRFSWFRLSVLVVVLGMLGYAAFAAVSWVRDSVEIDTEAAPWFAAYVDVTATPSFPMETATGPGTAHTVLSFVVADADGGCTPSWGAAYSLRDAAADLDLDRRIARMRAQDRDIVVSFGGQANTALASACADATSLERAYREVVERYELTTIDLDVEGDALGDADAGERRATAVASLQQERRDAGSELAVWLTLPVTRSGLTAEGAAEVTRLLDAGVDLAGVNAMTMDFGDGVTGTMADAAIDALTAVHRQLGKLYGDAGIQLGERTLWRKTGATPMIGQNDVPDEVFTLDDARELNAFAVEKGIGRMSMWSLNRDTSCSANYPDPTRVSDACSGIAQGEVTFAGLLSADILASPDSAVTRTTSEPVDEDAVDDPATSPYPIWNATASYPAGSKVVWHRAVYEAKWWTEGDVPDDPVLQEFETPWRLIGPVLDGETPIPVPSLPEDFYPAWDPQLQYQAGTRVMLDGIAYQSRWWNQASSPELALADPGTSPWQRLSDTEVLRLLGEDDGAARG